jgi:hypothetical protein
MQTYSEGTAMDIIDLLADFKRENNLVNSSNQNPSLQQPPSPPPPNPAKEAKKAALSVVANRHGAVSPSLSPADTYEDAFDEALNR